MSKLKVFFIMPFKDDFFEVYEMLKMKFGDKFEFSNAGDENNQQNILKDIIQPIFRADVIIADLTGLNPNVMYELGLAHTFNKKTIIITQDDLSCLPFDLKQYRTKNYDTHFKKFEELVNYLNTNLDGALTGNVSYSNPVKDFLILENISDINWFSENQTNIPDDISEHGFLDYLADIESNTSELANEINAMTTEMNEMNEGISKSVSEIERVKKTGGNSVTTFVHKETKKAAGCMDKFSKCLREHNKRLPSLWNEVEKNNLGLLENKFILNDCNKEALVDYLKTLVEMKKSIDGSNSSIEKLKTSISQNIGIERSMNQAIRFLEQDLITYLDITENIKSSIDRIINKSKYVVGEIEFK